MLVVGLTGGIGSGKTAVSDRFARYGTPVIDTDLLARELVPVSYTHLDVYKRQPSGWDASYANTARKRSRCRRKN